MCARIINCFNAIYGVKFEERFTEINLKNFEDHEFVEKFINQHFPIWKIDEQDKYSIDVGVEVSENFFEQSSLELLKILLHTEKFMRISVNSLETMREILPSVLYFERPSKFSLQWIFYAQNLARDIRHLFHENEVLRSQIILQRITLKPALAEFIKLLSLIQSTYKVWSSEKDDPWYWPSINTNGQHEDWQQYCPYVDLVDELEKVQKLLKKQDESTDRLGRSNFASACAVVNQAFSDASKVLAIRIDLGFSKGARVSLLNERDEVIQPRSEITIELFAEYLDKFIKKINSKSSFGWDRLGYIIKIEYGIYKGYHAHMLLLLNGHRHQQDIVIAKKIGESWVDIVTQGTGVYWNCNAQKNKYRNLGIGMIHRDDVSKRDNLKNEVLKYLVKYDLPFDFMSGNKNRKFRTSTVRKINI